MTVEENLDMGAYTQPASTIAANKEKVFTLSLIHISLAAVWGVILYGPWKKRQD